MHSSLETNAINPNTPVVIVCDNDPQTVAMATYINDSNGWEVIQLTDTKQLREMCSVLRMGCVILSFDVFDKPQQFDRTLTQLAKCMPIIATGANTGLSAAINAIHNGAFHFLEKPLQVKEVAQTINSAIESQTNRVNQQRDAVLAHSRYTQLTRREGTILSSIANGDSSRMIAHELGISHKTVESHRASIKRKLDAANVAESVSVFYKAMMLRPFSSRNQRLDSTSQPAPAKPDALTAMPVAAERPVSFGVHHSGLFGE